jgi:signal transduction histidine kinase
VPKTAREETPVRDWRLPVAFWGALGLLLSLVFAASDLLIGRRFALWYWLCLGFYCALLWALALPPLSRLADRHPLEGRGFAADVAFHLSASIAFSIVLTFLFAAFMWGIDVGVFGARGSFWLAFGQAAYYFLLPKCLYYWAAILARRAWRSLERYRQEAERRGRLEAALRQAQLGALRAQMRPHFLFNTLHTVGALIRMGRSHDALSAVAGLGDLLRASLQGDDRLTVPLAQELELVDTLLRIAKSRFPDRLRIERQVEPGLEDAEVPQLVLQPLVENALAHAVEADPDAGRLCLRAVARNGGVELGVEDDGPGLPPGWSLEGANGVGLRNTRARLEALYGSAADLGLEPAAPRGTYAWIRLPLERAAR